MTRVLVGMVALVQSVASFNIHTGARPASHIGGHRAAPVMQFWKQKDAPKGGKGGGGTFYDDEVDTTNAAGTFAWWKPEDSSLSGKPVEGQKFRSEMERAGFAEDGSDLANAGGLFSFGYGDTGNF